MLCVQQTIGVSEKNELLISVVYSNFCQYLSQSVAAKNLTQRNNEARSKLSKAKCEGSTSTTGIKELVSSFFHIVRTHSIAKRQVRTCEK